MMKKGLLTGIFGLFVALITSSTTYAADSSSGCGIGWQVLPKQSLVSSFSRAMINGTFSNTIAGNFLKYFFKSWRRHDLFISFHNWTKTALQIADIGDFNVHAF